MKVNLRSRNFIPLWRVRIHMQKRGSSERETAEFISKVSRVARMPKRISPLG